MTKRPLGRTSFSVSPLGFGGAPAAFLKPDTQAIVAMLNHLLDSGMNVLDTAAMYGESETFIGQHLSHRRKDFVLISKCGTKVADIDAPEWSAELISATVDRALRRLKTDVIDVMLLHTCDLPTLQNGEAIGALVAARQAGKIRHAGYSGDNEAVAFAAALPDVAVVETSINICDQTNIDSLLPVVKQHNVGVIAKRPVANAAWKDNDMQPGMYKSYSKPYTERLQKMQLTPADLDFTGDPQKAWPEIAIRFTLSQGGVSTAVIGTTNPANAMANFTAVEKGPLPPDAVQKLRDAFRRADPTGQWRGLT